MAAPQPRLFITKGLLPENLPSVFTSRTIWDGFSSLGISYGITRDCIGDAALFNASKRGGQRRLFKVPHPAFIRDQALFFEKHWTELSGLLNKSPGSASKPSFHRAGPRHVRITPHADLPRIRLQAFSRFRYCLVTDVARFFPSIYTHSLPWAINGKATAKGDTRPQSSVTYGNRLDFILRQSQSKQTIGIAIGPDTSKVAAELIMAAVDQRFVERSGANRPTFVRHVDDYWIAGNSQSECEKHLQNLRTALSEYELDINESKTKVISAKYVFADDWPFDFDEELRRRYNPINKELNNPLPLLSKIVDHATELRDDGVIRHVIRKLDDSRLWINNWALLEHFLAQCSVQFPHSFDYVARVVAWRVRRDLPIDKNLWIDVSKLLAETNAAAGNDSETVWALWLLKELRYRLPKSLSSAIIDNNGALVLAFLAHFGVNRLSNDRHLEKSLMDSVEGDPISGSSWPVTLELSHLGKADASWLSGAKQATLKMLHEKKLSIIDWQAPPKVFSDDDDGGPDEPDNALEDYGDDYGYYEDDEETADASAPRGEGAKGDQNLGDNDDEFEF